MHLDETKGFPGGIHPTDGYDKSLTMDVPVREYWPETVTILAEQSFRGPCSLKVRPGDHVREGQQIGEPEDFMAAPLHASVTGEVIKTEMVKNQGREMLACVIRRQEEPERQIQDYEKKGISLSGIDREEILEGIREGGLTGMGGAGFPTFRKYETDKQMDALLINGAECEPFLTCDYRLMTEQGYGLWNGVRLLLKASGAKKAYVCIEDNKPAAIENLRKILEEIKGQGILEPSEDLEVKALPARYPHTNPDEQGQRQNHRSH